MATITVPFKPPDPAPLSGSNGSGKHAPALTAQVMTITPALARQWDAEDKSLRRPLRRRKIIRFAEDMQAGRWALNGQTIKRTADRRVIDGWHRLVACVEAGVPFDSLVVDGLPPEVIDTVDTGTARTMADQLTLRGEKHSAVFGATARWAYFWLRGQRIKGSGDADPSHSQLMELIEAEPRIREAAEWADHARAVFKPVAGSVWGMAWLALHGADHLAAEVFLNDVLTGANLPEKHPALAFRNRIIRAKFGSDPLNPNEQLACLIICWNAWRAGRDLDRPNLPKGSLTSRNFPAPK
jgi:hypothetical protein